MREKLANHLILQIVFVIRMREIITGCFILKASYQKKQKFVNIIVNQLNVYQGIEFDDKNDID